MKHLYTLTLAVFATSAMNAQVLQEDFSSASGATPPTGWTATDLSSSGVNWVFDNPSEYPVDPPFSGKIAVLDSDFFSDTESDEDAILVSPVFNASGLTGNLVLTFDHMFVPDMFGAWAVEVYDGVTWTEVLNGSGEMSDPESVYLDITTAAGMSANAQIRFHWTGVYDYFWMVDNVTVFEETCPPVSALGASAITAGGALAAWSPGDAETDWNISYGLSGFSPEDGTIAAVDTDPQYAITGLNTGQTYEFYVQSDCGGNGTSVWVGPYSFTTLCAPAPITSLPWVDQFESATIPALPCGWASENTNADDTEWITEEFEPGDQALVLYYNFDGVTPSDDWAFTPEFVLQTGVSYQLIFDEIMGFGDYEENLSVMIGSDQTSASMSTLLLNLEGVSTDEFTNHIVNFTVPADGSYHFGFHGYSEPDLLLIYLNNVKVRVAPTCPEVTEVSVSDLIGSSATVTWTPGLSETDWIIEIGEQGFTPGDGDISNVSGTPVVTFSDLDNETAYDVYVTADCGSGDLGEAVMVSFTSLCTVPPVTDFPWTEDFETTDLEGLPCGWTQNNLNGDDVMWSATDYSAASGLQSIGIQWNSDEPMDDWAMTPGFEMTGGTEYTISFNYGTGGSFNESFEFFYGNTQSVTAMTNSLADFNDITNEEFINQEISFTPASSGIYYFGFHGNSEADQFILMIDDFMIEENCGPETAEFAYAETEFCVYDNGAAPEITGTTGGMFSAPAGLAIDASTGMIDPSASTAGTYDVSYISSTTGCADTLTASITISQCLGLEESVLSSVSLYPNPSNGKVHLNVSAEAGNVVYTVTDITGKIIINALPVTGTGTTIDLTKEQDGVYFVSLSTGDDSKTYRIVLTK